MLKFRDYVRVETITEFEQAVASIDGPVLLVAGGSDVLVQAREDGRYKNHTAVDIFGIKELRLIEEQEDQLVIGACATHQAIAQSELVKKYAPILVDTVLSIGSPQIRNHATIGGNIANASPAADTLASLLVLGAQLVVLKQGVDHILPLADIFEGPYSTNLSDRDLILSIRFPKLDGNVLYNYSKVGRRKALATSRMTVATLLQTDVDGTVKKFEMTLGATFPKPALFPDISALLVGKRPTEEAILEVARALSEKIPETAGIRASTRYKQHVCLRLSERILKELIGDGVHA